jgi:hypothetical protein
MRSCSIPRLTSWLPIERSLPEYWLLKSAAHLLSVPIGRIFALAPLLNLLLIVLAVVLLDTLCD